MKTPKDPRHVKREKTIKSLFEWSFGKINQVRNKQAAQILKSLPKIDKIITQNAPEWPLPQINKTDLAILRLAIWELAIKPSQPPKVVIDEAIELGKKYGSEKSPGFINGVLGAVVKQKKLIRTKDEKSSKS